MAAKILPSNLRLAARTLRREPTFLITAVLSLAVAIALNTTLYSMFEAMLEPRVAGGHPERVYTLQYYGDAAHVLPRDAVSQTLATGGRTYDGLTGYRKTTITVGISRGDRAREVAPLTVRADFFDVLGVRPIEGVFVATQAGEQQAIVISDRLRGELFPETRTVVGTAVTLGGRPSTIVAVVHRNSAFSVINADVWTIASGANDEQVPLNLIRAREGATAKDVYEELTTLAARLALAAGEPTQTRFVIKSIMREFTMWGFHYALIGGVVAILLVACANLGNLQLARSLNRGTEIAIRSAVGARPRNIVTLLLTEVGIIAAAGLTLGLVGSVWGIGLLRASIPESTGGFFGSPEVSWRMVLFAVSVSLFCIAFIGLVPAVRASRADLNGLIKRGAGTGAHRENRRRYGWLLIVQIGLTLPVVSAAVLLARAGWQMRDPFYAATQLYGFDPDSVIVAHVTIAAPRNTYVHIAPIADRLLGDARAIPDVSNAAVMLYSQPTKMGVTVADSSGRVTEFPTPMWSYKLISPGYYRTIGLPIERGVDLIEGAYDVSAVMVDRATSTFFWPDGYRPGSMIKLGNSRSTEPWLPVKGVRGDHLDPDARLWRAWFDTLRVEEVARVITASDSVRAGRTGLELTLYARARRNPQVAAIALRQQLRSRNLIPPPTVKWMADEVGITAMRASQQFMTSIFTGAAVICLALAALGVYGIVAQSIAQRRREIAVRIALGAMPGDVIRAIMREGNVFALAGVAAGLMITMRTIGWLGGLLGINRPAESPNAWKDQVSGSLTFTFLAAALFLTAALAALVPAARAARIDPVEALKSD